MQVIAKSKAAHNTCALERQALLDMFLWPRTSCEQFVQPFQGLEKLKCCAFEYLSKVAAHFAFHAAPSFVALAGCSTPGDWGPLIPKTPDVNFAVLHLVALFKSAMSALAHAQPPVGFSVPANFTQLSHDGWSRHTWRVKCSVMQQCARKQCASRCWLRTHRW
jgi:hypothetical protein